VVSLVEGVCMKGHTRELEKFLEMYVNTRSISFLREEPHVFASRIFTFFSSLLFPSTEDRFLDGLKAKALHCLWNTVIDDIVEYTDKGKDNIIDSLHVVTKYRNGMNFSGKTESGQIMHDFIQRFYNLPSGTNKKIAEELLFLDLTRILNGFDYERIIQENGTTHTLSEYLELGATTMDLRVFLDIDISLYPYNFDPLLIGDFREAYKWFSLAFKLSSDIATFEREFFVERSNNAVILYGQEQGVLPRDVLRSDTEYKKKLLETVIPSLMEDVEYRGRKYLSKSIECLKKINDIDTGGIAAAFSAIFENYPGQRIYSPPAT
jgi:hypothetical protein